MTIRGKHDGAKALCKALTDYQLLQLARDVLVMRGHTDIRLVDGPGDGGRDISSITPRGDGHITQVTHTRQPSKAIGARKIAELPIALMKFGATHGLFVTTGKISPQAQRECLNDYPDFTLDFLDGEGLADEILRRAPLKYIWFDGGSFGQVSNRVRIPFIIRDLEHDKPIRLSNEELEVEWAKAIDCEYQSDMDVTAEHDEVHHSELGAYRAPRKRLWFEGMSSRITAQQFLLSGPLSLEAIDAAAHALAVAVLERLNGAQPRRLVAVRMGQPQLVPLRGDWAGRSIAVGQGPFTLIADCGRIANEWDWLAEVGPEWVRAIGLRSSNADWLRRYHPVLDACVSVELITVMTENARLETEAVAQIHERDWERSAYCLLNGGPELALSDAPLEPTERYLWADGRTFAIWHFRAFAGPLAVLDSDHDEPDWGMPTAEQERSVLSVIERVRRWMSERGHESLAPRTARYMRALLAGDPYPTHRMRYRFVDLEMGKTYPSPIDPRERSVLADIAWRLEVDVDEAVEELIDDVLAQWSRACGISRDSYLYELDDPDELAATHWFLRVQVADNVDPLLSTRDHVDGLMKSLPEKLGQLEEMLAQATPGTTRATRQYWRDLCFLDFQVPVEAQR